MVYKHKTLIPFILSIGLVLNLNAQESWMGGFRVDQAGFFVNIVEKVAGICLSINGLRLELTAAPESAGLNFFTKTKDDYNEDIVETKRNLITYLASTPDGSDPISIKFSEGTRSNKELVEVANAVTNLSNLVNNYRAKLRENKSDVQIARDYYICQYECLVILTEISEEFVINIDKQYKPNLREFISKLENLKDQTYQQLRKTNLSYEKESLNKIIQQQEYGIKNAGLALSKLDDQKYWAKRRLNVLEGKVEIARLAKETAVVLHDIMQVIDEINRVLAALKNEPLPLIVFEVDYSQFNISSDF